VEPSFLPSIVDRMIKVPDEAAYATIHFLEELLNRKCGGSTGTNVYAAFQIISELNKQGESGSVVSMICDSGDRYLETYYSDGWLNQNGFNLTHYKENLEKFYRAGVMPEG
jgi:cysteine synthase A